MKQLACRVAAARALIPVIAATGCVLALLPCAPAHAQGVTLFGIIDSGVEVLSNVGPSGGRLVRVPSLTGEVSSRLGFRAQEDLGGGLGALVVLEMGLAPDGGTLLQGGRAFGRQALVGLTSPWGTFSAGRQYTMLYWSLLDADILGPNLYGTGSLDAGIPNARSDNTLAWRGSFGAFTAGATYSLGRDAVNAGPSPSGTNCPGESTDARACRGWSVMLKYDAPQWGAALADDRQHGRALGPAPDAVFGGLDSSTKVDRRLSANGWARWGDWKLGAGLVRRQNDGDAVKPDSKLWYLGAAWRAGELTIDGEWVGLRHNGQSAYDASLAALRATYNLSKRTAVYAQVGHIDNARLSALSVSAGAAGGNPAAGRSQHGMNAGIRHAF